MPSRRCCCEGTDCSAFPLCWTVTFADIDSCPDIEASFNVPYTSTRTWTCNLPAVCTDCGDLTITVSINVAEDTLTVTVGSYEWEATITDYCDDYIEMPVVSDGGDTAPKASLSPKTTGPCTCACNIYCSKCGGTQASYVEVVIDGAVSDECTSCEDLDGTYLLPLLGTSLANCARYTGSFPDVDFCDNVSDCTGLYLDFDILTVVGVLTYQLSVWGLGSGEGACGEDASYFRKAVPGGSPTDCVGFSLTFDSGDLVADNQCDWSSVSISIQAAGTV